MEFLESDLIRSINQDGNQQTSIEANKMEYAHNNEIVDRDESIVEDE